MFFQTFKITRNRITNICHCFVTSFPLRDAAGQAWAFGDKYAIFVGFNRDTKFHVVILAIDGMLRNANVGAHDRHYSFPQSGIRNPQSARGCVHVAIVATSTTPKQIRR